MELKWLVVYVASRQEKKVSQRLTDRGIEHYLPLSKQIRQWSDRRKMVEFPLFNGYLFVRPKAEQRDLITSVAGVVCYLRFGGREAVVTDREMEVIRRIEAAGYYAESMLTPDDFTEGEAVMVTEGPLKGQQGQLLRRHNERTFVILFETLGQCLRIQLPYDMLSKVEGRVD